MRPIASRACEICGEALNVVQRAIGGAKQYLHSGQRPDRPYAHPTEAVRLADLGREPVIRCDVCSALTAVWVYQSDDQQTHHNDIVRQDVAHGDYVSRHQAARVRRTVTERRQTQNLGERWSACDDCATAIERKDLLALISRGIDGLPATLTGKRLIRRRGELHDLYGHFLDTLKPSRGHISPEHPLGVWPDPPTGPT
jgi:hypothetical protein